MSKLSFKTRNHHAKLEIDGTIQTHPNRQLELSVTDRPTGLNYEKLFWDNPQFCSWSTNNPPPLIFFFLLILSPAGGSNPARP